MSHADILSPVDLAPPSARPVPHPNRGDGWDILADVEVFILAVEAELAAMDRERVGVHRRGCKPDLSLRRRLIWMMKSCPRRWWSTAAHCAPRRAHGCGASMVASWLRVSSSS